VTADQRGPGSTRDFSLSADNRPDCISQIERREAAEKTLRSPGSVLTVEFMERRFTAMRNQERRAAILPSALYGTGAEASG
jgi:hypothetical protein